MKRGLTHLKHTQWSLTITGHKPREQRENSSWYPIESDSTINYSFNTINEFSFWKGKRTTKEYFQPFKSTCVTHVNTQPSLFFLPMYPLRTDEPRTKPFFAGASCRVKCQTDQMGKECENETLFRDISLPLSLAPVYWVSEWTNLMVHTMVEDCELVVFAAPRPLSDKVPVFQWSW